MVGSLVATSDSAVAIESAPQWYVAETKPFEWTRAERELRRQEFSLFNPKVLQRKGVGRFVRERRSLYIPGYMFVRFDLELDYWQTINSTPGIKSLMMFKSSEKPIPVRSALVEALMARCDCVEDDNGNKDWFVRVKQADEYLFAVGQQLKILVGPFAGLPAVVSMSSKSRLDVLISIFGRTNQVSIKTADLGKMVEVA